MNQGRPHRARLERRDDRLWAAMLDVRVDSGAAACAVAVQIVDASLPPVERRVVRAVD